MYEQGPGESLSSILIETDFEGQVPERMVLMEPPEYLEFLQIRWRPVLTDSGEVQEEA
jgi:UDP-N-acetylglucosamine 2-epimerase